MTKYIGHTTNPSGGVNNVKLGSETEVRTWLTKQLQGNTALKGFMGNITHEVVFELPPVKFTRVCSEVDEATLAPASSEIPSKENEFA